MGTPAQVYDGILHDNVNENGRRTLSNRSPSPMSFAKGFADESRRDIS